MHTNITIGFYYSIHKSNNFIKNKFETYLTVLK